MCSRKDVIYQLKSLSKLNYIRINALSSLKWLPRVYYPGLYYKQCSMFGENVKTGRQNVSTEVTFCFKSLDNMAILMLIRLDLYSKGH